MNRKINAHTVRTRKRLQKSRDKPFREGIKPITFEAARQAHDIQVGAK